MNDNKKHEDLYYVVSNDLYVTNYEISNNEKNEPYIKQINLSQDSKKCLYINNTADIYLIVELLNCDIFKIK